MKELAILWWVLWPFFLFWEPWLYTNVDSLNILRMGGQAGIYMGW
jgi:hypothetical protein